MDYLKMDPDILISFINTKLRNNNSSLDELCDDLDIKKVDLEEILKKHGYLYDVDIRQFK